MARRVIALRGTPIVDEQETAVEALIPGHVLILGSSGYSKNTANAANVAPIFALERDELGKDIDEAYAISDRVKAGFFHAGQRVYAWLASGHNVAKGDYLTGDNAELLSKTGVTTAIRLAQALEAVNTSGSAPVAGTRIRVQIV
jgi:hypothetical protein